MSGLPQNLLEQLAYEEVRNNPFSSDARILTNIVMGDSRWNADDGWCKVERIVHISHYSCDYSDIYISVHYVGNIRTKEVADFKIKQVTYK